MLHVFALGEDTDICCTLSCVLFLNTLKPFTGDKVFYLVNCVACKGIVGREVGMIVRSMLHLVNDCIFHTP
jgi:hypothetical protein